MDFKVLIALVGVAACAEDTGEAAGTASHLRALPNEDGLCKVFVGTPTDRSGFKSYGAHIEDVEGVWGAPEGKASNRLVYAWDQDGKTVRATLEFEAARLCFRDSGKELTPGLWLKSITPVGMTAPSCWAPDPTNTRGTCGGECVDTADLRKCQ